MVTRALHVTPYMAEAAGGPPVVVRRLTDGARRAGWEVEILTSPDYSDDSGTRLVQEEGVTLVSSQLSALSGPGRALVKRAIEAADIVHCHTMWSPLVTCAAATARNMGKPYIFSPHGMLDPYSFGQKNLKKRLYLKAFERQTVARAARVLFTAEQERILAEESFGQIARPAVISLGADRLPGSLEDLRKRFVERHPELADRRILLFMGRLHPKKRPELLLEVVQQLGNEMPDVALLYAGTGEAQHVDDLKSEVAERGLFKQVRFLGHLDGLDKAAALAAADLFLLPSQQENFAIAVAEALHASTPVVVTKKVNIWPEIVEAEAGYALDEANLAAEIGKIVVTVLSNSHLRHNLAGNAKNLAVSRYTWSEAASETIKLYREVLGSTSAS